MVISAVKFLLTYVALPLLVSNLLLHVFAGITFWFINPVRLEVCHLQIKGKCNIGSLRFSPRHKKIFIENLTIFEPNDKSKKKQDDDTSSAEGFESKENVSNKKFPGSLENSFPFVIRILNGLQIEITNLNVKHIQLKVEDIRAVIKYQHKNKNLTVHAGVRDASWIAQSICEDFSLTITTKLALHRLGQGIPLENTVTDIKVFDVLVPMDFVQMMKSSSPSSQSPLKEPVVRQEHYKEYTDPDFDSSLDEALQSVSQKADQLRKMIDPISEINVVIDRITVRSISMAPIPELRELDEAMTYNIYASNIKLEIGKFESYMPGFKLLFADEDTPMKVGLMVSNFAMSLEMKKKCHFLGNQSIKVLETPSISLFGSSNLLSQKFDLSEVSGLKNALLSLRCNVLSPTFDIDVNHLSFYKTFKRNISVFAGSLKDTSCTSADITAAIWKKHLMLLFFKRCLPLIDLKFTLEDARLLVSDGDDMMVYKLTALLLRYHTERYLLHDSKKVNDVNYDGLLATEVLGMRLEHSNKAQNYKKRIALIESISLRVAIDVVPKLLLSSSIDLDTLNVDVSDLPTMIALNNIFRKLDIQMQVVEQNYFKPFYEKFEERLHIAEKQKAKARSEINIPEVLPSSFVFKELPSFFDFVKISLSNVSFSVGCRSVFMPPEVFSNIDAQSPEDMVNGQLRKICHKVNKTELVFFGTKTQFSLEDEGDRIRMIKSSPDSDYKSYKDDSLDNLSGGDSAEVARLWNFGFLINGVSSVIIAESPESVNELTTRRVFELSAFSLKVFPDVDSNDSETGSKVLVRCDTKRIFSVTSLMFAFLIISGVHTLKQIFGRDIALQDKQSMAKTHFIALSEAKKRNFLSNVKWSELKQFLEIQFVVDRFSQVLDLPNGLKTRLEFYSVFLSLQNLNDIVFTGGYARLCVESPAVKKSWVRLLTITHFKVLASIFKIKRQAKKDAGHFALFEPSITLENESWHFNIPYQFEMYRLFDNISTVVKSFKQMMYSFTTCKNDVVVFPKVVKAPALPKIKLLSQRMNFTIDDDPFEAELSMIFQIGLKEQKIRLAKIREFDAQIRAELAQNSKNQQRGNHKETYNHKSFDLFHKLATFRGKSTHKKKFHCNLVPKITVPFNIDGDDGADDGVKEEEYLDDEPIEMNEEVILQRAAKLFKKLEENFSTSWINRIKQFKHTQRESFYNNFSYLWGDIDYTKLPPDVNYRVLPFSTNPFLSTMTVEEIDIDIFQPSFGMDKIADFIYNVGKKVPLDTEYSMLIPMYLDAKFQEIRWHLRDYPLPFIYIPRLDNSQGCERTSINIHGDFVLGEDIIRSERELRTLFIPLIPSIVLENTDCYYSLLIPRTITAMKVFTDLKLDFNSMQTTQVTWGGGYQPAIQQTMQCFDNFSKPPLDPSSKTGFWDKLRYLFHARIKISWNNHGRFEVGLKGGKSPHKIGADSAGFLVGFHKNITLTVNEDGDPKKFVSCSADEIYFSIPNYFAKPLLVWSRPSNQTVFVPIHSEPTLQDYAFFYYLCDLDTTMDRLKQVRTMGLHYIEKTGIKLTGGVTLNVGTNFERLISGSRERTFDSVPHYKIQLSNPIYLSDRRNHDSYAGFRSDFIHLSFTLLSASSSAYNALQLSPAGLDTFLKWWKSFAGNFPVRSGPLFGLQSISPKFGDHLRTISYRADVSPLFVSYTAHGVNISRLTKKAQSDVQEFAGVKAKATKFVMDLHQRKEVLITFQEELNRTKQIMKLNFLGGEVLAKKLDIRTVQGNFKPMKIPGDKNSGVFEVFDNDMAWYDVTDFKEAYALGLENYIPHVRIKPFLYTPHFVYRKRASYGDKYQVDPKDHQPIPPFRNDISHDCTLGETELLQLGVLEQRVHTLEDLKIMKTKEDGDACHEDFMRKLDLEVEKARNLFEDFKHMQNYRGDPTDSYQYHYELPNLMKQSRSDSYEHRYCVNYALLRWNEDTRDALFKFLHYISLAYQFSQLSATKSLQIIEDVVKQKTESILTEEGRDYGPNPTKKPTKKIDVDTLDESNLNYMLSGILERHMSELEVPVKHLLRNNHFVEFLSPQIQMVSHEDPDSCVMLTSSGVKMEVVSFDGDLNGDEYRRNTMLKRYGIHVINSNVFHFRRKDFMDHPAMYFDIAAYGHVEGTSWPPWVALELCFDSNQVPEEAIIMKNLSFALCYDKLSELSSYYNIMKERLQNKLSGYFPKVSISSDSKTYASFYRLVKTLCLYTEPDRAELRKQIDKLTIGFDLGNVTQMRNAIQGLHENLRMLSTVESAFLFKRQILDDVDKFDFDNVQSEKIYHLLRLYIMIEVFISNSRGSDNGEGTLLWDFHVGTIALHLLMEKVKPFLDIDVEGVHIERLQSSNGFNNNKVVATGFRIRDMREGVTYQNVIGPIDSKYLTDEEKIKEAPLVSIDWQMNEPVGGIKVAKSVDTRITGLDLNLEDEMITKVVRWFLPDELKNSVSDDSSGDNDSSDLASTIAPTEEGDISREITLEKHGDLNEMVQRSSDFIILERLTLNTFKVCVSFRGKGALRLANVTDFVYNFPTLKLQNQTMRVADLLMILKKVLIKDLLKHTGKFLGAKVSRRRDTSSVGSEKDGNLSMIGPLKKLPSFSSSAGSNKEV
ncbi:hypothetical protein ZYGR_0AK00550 [Zygosaccharomyces rouxii]|uniref:Protein FMP27, mitochondrial n=1 Tax=Zygosaccharomyces rouxii TaxID=4956 RepID=A0A1Q3ADH4_ZYGRO|nr:hypothetical protein ZYGR_0AK00550 [Zygosaccharomyces rouxii]